MKPLPAQNFYAVVCPNWGEPYVMVSTISEKEDAAIDKAIVDPEHGLWSGASFHCVPMIRGKWQNMISQGYTVRKITITEAV